jgi:hypothetical protein
MEDNLNTSKIEDLVDLIEKFPNDYELGKKVREMFKSEFIKRKKNKRDDNRN